MHSQTIIITTLALAIAASAKPKATPCTITSTYTESECCPQYPAQTEWIISNCKGCQLHTETVPLNCFAPLRGLANY
ncbi:hypothetical protein CLAFUW4_08280 [Fulvia fulva]|uniref:Uncharacterized protein n=1 Tax=Passalora fulva TaxID=5499 RepID=A0A9Q8LC59_PASFU|nr:uncharacterized protein CLAFUR5_08389 [Fulvia fulva]KAK4628699.1 hypothetical protein CLAFUR4_08285 [Fulvia fulva]KAK4630751.1 hypothetical protein CLAFUR0_08280 [Fulvia fulva]UJO14796.1 hypothetical protein CLAFUR5_08389 [Fulvia fulva]WPV12494.1 hypothetical protein CLAFUW4_08280 [Fulvia fulva]WPV28029.1 hypothetical protein CLAFUW7_08280 [Fulvia fulva]